MHDYTVTVYDKAFARKGEIGYRWSGRIVLNWLATGYVEVTLPSTHPRTADLHQPGARCVVSHRGNHILSGTVTSRAGSRQAAGVDWTYTVLDDFAELQRLLCRPNPGLPVDSQTAEYDSRSGPAESVLKAVVTANASPVTPWLIPASSGRGLTVRASWRYHPLFDRLKLESSGIGVRVIQDGTHLLLDVWEPARIEREIAYPIVREWDAEWLAPTVTRVIAGAQGEGQSRAMTEWADEAMESTWGMTRTVFIDARDLDTTVTDDAYEQTGRILEALSDGRPGANVKVTLTESPGFSFRDGYHLGDVITMNLDPLLPVVAERIRQVTITVTPDSGVSVTPSAGTVQTSSQPRLFARMARRLRNMERA